MSDEGPIPRSVTALDGDAERALRRMRQQAARVVALGLAGLAVGVLVHVYLISVVTAPVCVVAGGRKLTRAHRIQRILEHSGWGTHRARVLRNERGRPSSLEVATGQQGWQPFMIVGSNVKLAAGIRDTERIEIARTVGATYVGVVRAPGTGEL